MAMLAHGSILINLFTGFGGLIVALLIWLVKRQESPWVGFQGLQALLCQAITGAVLFVLWLVSFILIFVLIGFLLIPLVFILSLGVLAYGLYGAYRCYTGSDFRYLWLGDFLASQQTNP